MVVRCAGAQQEPLDGAPPLIAALAGWPATRLLAQDEAARPHQKISAAELHRALDERFPLRFGLPGLVAVQVDAAQLLLVPARQRLGATLQARVRDLQSRATHAGEIDVSFALRYEGADRTLRAHGLQILDLRWPGLPPDSAQALRLLLAADARDAFGELVLHRFSQEDLAVPDTMGFEPGEVQVVDDGLVVWFRPKAHG